MLSSSQIRVAILDDLEKSAEPLLSQATQLLSIQPRTITAVSCPRSPGGPAEFYSEADYWWPCSGPDGLPYVRRDGFSNPDNFSAHRELLITFSEDFGTLVSAWELTRSSDYADKACEHLEAWFLTESTRMRPHLEYAQAVRGLCTGRDYGIVDTVHLIEVAVAIERLLAYSQFRGTVRVSVIDWFRSFLGWLVSHPYGKSERNRKNNHGTAWLAQVTAYARLVGDTELVSKYVRRFKKKILVTQVAEDGNLPLEVARTRPYNYFIFNMELMAAICQLDAGSNSDLWHYQTETGQSMKRVFEFITPFLESFDQWPYEADVAGNEHWPCIHHSLLLAAVAFAEERYWKIWKALKPPILTHEIRRNRVIRQPNLWIRPRKTTALTARTEWPDRCHSQ